MRQSLLPALLFSVLLLTTACSGGQKQITQNPAYSYLTPGAKVYLQYNLHHDPSRRIYNTNYQLPMVMPRCTPVTIVNMKKKGVTFQLESGVNYVWAFEKYVKADRGEHFGQFFAQQCDDVTGLSEIDQQGIAMGRPLEGMTKQGVVYAMGLPPDHKTPSLDQDLWTYWRNRYVTTTIRFENGVVVEIK